MALLLQLRTNPKPQNPFTKNPTFLFSSSSSCFKDLKHTLKQQQSHPKPSTTSFTSSKQQPSLDEIRRNLSEFRRRTASGDEVTSPSQHTKPVSFQELYDRSLLQKPPEPAGYSGSGHASGSGRVSLDSIRVSLKNIGAARSGDWSGVDPMSLREYKDAFRLKPPDSSSAASSSPEKVIGGTSVSPDSLFGREMRKKRDRDGSSAAAMAARSGFVRVYGYGEMGEKLRKLRPEVKGKEKEWFSIGELNERLMRLRENEEKEAEYNSKGGSSFKDWRECLIQMKETNDDESRKSSLLKFNILSQLGGTPAYFLDPPKEPLVEKYLHPDNMSSAEKLKIELAKIREEFKMSESDCGSARVQVAQLTTKIKHLSAVLHKKDVHSRKGLLAMVQRRKRLLKYLRRTDWDSYCFVISKLGLRDNPDHSHKTQRTGRSSLVTSS